MPAADPSVIDVLSSADGSVRRLLVRDASGQAVEAIECDQARAEALPWGGVFAAYDRRGARVLLGPVLARRLVDLRPPPIAALGLVRWLLQDLDRLHASGGAHGAIHVDGVGFDATGLFQVRAAFGQAQPTAGTPQAQDVVAVGRVIAALTSVAALEGEGITRAKLWWNGMGIDGGRVGFPDARAARQALGAAIGRRDLDLEMSAFLARIGGRLPPAAVAFRVRPVGSAPVRVSDAGLAAEKMADARAVLDQELSELRSQRFDRARSRVEDELQRMKATREHAAALRAAPIVTGAVVNEAGPLQVVLDPRRAQAARAEEEGLRGRGDPIFRMKIGSDPGSALETLDGEPELDAHLIPLSLDSGVESGEAERRYSVDEVPELPEVAVEGDGGAPPEDADDDPTTEVQELGVVTEWPAEQEEEPFGLDAELRRFRDELDRRRAEDQARRARADAARAEDEARRAVRREAERAEAARVEAERAAAEAARVEAERVAAEAARVEAERVAAEAARVEAEREAAEAAEAARVEAERAAAEAARVEAERAAGAGVGGEAVGGQVDETGVVEVADPGALASGKGTTEGSEEEEEAAVPNGSALSFHSSPLAAPSTSAASVSSAVTPSPFESELMEPARPEPDGLAAEVAEVERFEPERHAEEVAEAARVECERLAMETERLAAEGAETARLESERLAAEAVEAERLESERLEAERLESERLESERLEAERLAAEAAESARLESERLAAESARLESERLAAESARLESERLAAESARLESERLAAEAARLESERLAAEAARQESDRAARLEAARVAARQAAASRAAAAAFDAEPATNPGSLSLDPERGLPASGRWEGAAGITGRSEREQELGPGKWTEQGRSLDELRRDLPTGPTRPMELEEPATRSPVVPILVGVAVLVLAVVAWLVFG